MKNLLFLLLLLCTMRTMGHGEEVPPLENKDPAITENFRQIYYAVDQLGITRNDNGYICIGGTTTCINSVSSTTLMNIFTASSGTVSDFYASSATINHANITGLLNLDGVVGSSGTYMVSQGQGATPIWQKKGLILQVITSTMSSLTQQTSTSATYSSTTLNVELTPLSNTSKILIFVSQSFGASGVAGTICTVRIRRDATNITVLNDQHAFIDDSATESDSSIPAMVVDSPGDTTRHIYSTVFARSAGTGTCIVNTTLGAVGGNGGYMILMEVSQ